MAVCWRSVTQYVILLHRPSAPVTPVLGIQKMIRMAAEGFYRREVDKMPYFDFSTEKFMFKRTWQVVFWGTRNDFGHPKQLATRLKAREGLHSKVVTPKSRKRGTKKWENERCNIQICFQEMGTAENMNAIYPCCQSIVNRIFSSFSIVSRDLFSATVRLVRGVRCIFEELLIMNFISANSSF